MQLTNGALFLNATSFYLFIYLFICFFALFGELTVIVLFTTIYASLKSHKCDINIDVLILISLLTS